MLPLFPIVAMMWFVIFAYLPQDRRPFATASLKLSWLPGIAYICVYPLARSENLDICEATILWQLLGFITCLPMLAMSFVGAVRVSAVSYVGPIFVKFLMGKQTFLDMLMFRTLHKSNSIPSRDDNVHVETIGASACGTITEQTDSLMIPGDLLEHTHVISVPTITDQEIAGSDCGLGLLCLEVFFRPCESHRLSYPQNMSI